MKETALTIELHKFGADDPNLFDLILNRLLGSNSFLAVKDTLDEFSPVSLLCLLLDIPPGDVESCLLKLRFKLEDSVAPDDGPR